MNDLCLEVVLRSCQLLRHIRRWISPLEIDAWFPKDHQEEIAYGVSNGHVQRDRWRQATPKGQTSDPNIIIMSKTAAENAIYSLIILLDSPLWGSYVGYNSDSMASCLYCRPLCRTNLPLIKVQAY